jgi:sugar diacid utilization regulator
VRVRDLVQMNDLALVVLTGDESLDRPIRWVYTTDLLDPARYLTGNDLVLTGMMWRRDPEDSETFVRSVASRDVSAVAAGDAAYGTVPDDLVAACRRHGLLLLEVPIQVSFATITEEVTRRLAAESGVGLAGVLSRRRRLLSAVAEGAGVDGLVSLWSADNGITCAVVATSGRVLASSAPPDGDDVDRLVRAFLTADRLPVVATLPGKRAYSLFPVGTSAPRQLIGWFLAGEGDYERWPREAQESVVELASLVGVERARVEEGPRATQRLAEQLVGLITSATRDPAELVSRLRAADVDPEATFVVVVVHAQGMVGPIDVPRALLDEVLRPSFPGIVIATLGQETVALVPVGASNAADVAEQLRRCAARLESVMGKRRLAIGVSDPTAGLTALRGALEEARHVCRLAELRPTHASVATADEVDSHVLLIASVPDDVRQSFRTRLLGPLLEYDEAHHSELVPTLEAFLDCSGSWQRCSERLHVHVNTLRYRMQRIEELTGRSLSSLEDRVDLFLALRVH